MPTSFGHVHRRRETPFGQRTSAVGRIPTSNSALRIRPRPLHVVYDYSQLQASPSSRLFPEWDGRNGYSKDAMGTHVAYKRMAHARAASNGASWSSDGGEQSLSHFPPGIPRDWIDRLTSVTTVRSSSRLLASPSHQFASPPSNSPCKRPWSPAKATSGAFSHLAEGPPCGGGLWPATSPARTTSMFMSGRGFGRTSR